MTYLQFPPSCDEFNPCSILRAKAASSARRWPAGTRENAVRAGIQHLLLMHLPPLNHFLHPDLEDESSLLRSYMIMARLTWLFPVSRQIPAGYFRDAQEERGSIGSQETI